MSQKRVSALHGQDGADLGRVESYQYPAAHVGHLSPQQQAALEKFKKICEAKKYYTPPPKASHDDETLLRYLRARKFIPNDAFVQFKDTEDWRAENKLDQLYETIDVDEYEQTRRLYPQWTGRRDKRGIPVYVFEVGHLNAKAVSAYESSTSTTSPIHADAKVPVKMLRLFALYENLCRFVMPLCSAVPNRPHSETPISQSNNIVDISNVGLKQFWNLKTHMQDASTLATAHYPETLDRIFVIGAPGFFPTVWGWIKRWFDPTTVSKIFILSDKTMKATLEQYIELENIPKKYGGRLDFKFGDMPMLEPIIAESMHLREDVVAKGHKTIPTGPIKWQEEESTGDIVAVACGSVNGKVRKNVIGKMHNIPNVAQMSLSPGRVANPQEMMFSTTTGSGTHPASPSDEVTDRTPSETEAMITSGNLNKTKPAEGAVPKTSGNGTSTVPDRDNEGVRSNNVPLEESDKTRQGTSSTRFAQQDLTHASGQVADGTPSLRDNGEGDKNAVMEPSTVGQAPKELPIHEPEAPAPSYVDQAKAVAGQAYEKVVVVQQQVLSAVGHGGAEEAKAEPELKKEDPAVDGMPGKGVEEYLRSRNMSTAAAAASKTA